MNTPSERTAHPVPRHPALLRGMRWIRSATAGPSRGASAIAMAGMRACAMKLGK